MTACSTCQGIEVVTYAANEARPAPYCGSCGRRFPVRVVEVERMPPWMQTAKAKALGALGVEGTVTGPETVA